jgi:hypothetical protein
MSNRRTAILTTLGVAVIMLVVGLAIGSVAFPLTKTVTITTFSVAKPCGVRQGAGWAFFVSVVADNTSGLKIAQPISGAIVSVISYDSCGNALNNYTSVTSSNGTVSFPTEGIDSYSGIIYYQGSGKFLFETWLPPEQITNVTLMVNSGNLTITHYKPS